MALVRRDADNIAQALLGTPFETLDDKAKRVTELIAERKHIARDMSLDDEDSITFGQKAADAVATFGGSWTFITIFATIMLSWIILNSIVLVRYGQVFDSYPNILLNLFLSMLAAIQAPIILMSQNRQTQKDRKNAEHDYEVNLKAELEIMMLHEKLDLLREGQWASLLEIQHEQIRLLTTLAAKNTLA